MIASNWLRRAMRQSKAPALISVSAVPWLTTLTRDSLEEVVERPERAAFFATGLDDRLDRLVADPLDRPQAELDLALLGHAELQLGRR